LNVSFKGAFADLNTEQLLGTRPHTNIDVSIGIGNNFSSFQLIFSRLVKREKR